MRAMHDSRSLEFRNPYGAVQKGGAVCLGLDVWDAEDGTTCELRLWTDEVGEELYTMDAEKNGDSLHFSYELAREDTGIVWYGFRLTQPDGNVCWYGAQEGRVGGVGELRGGTEGPSFQITVYEPRATAPEWYRGGVVYQIFPDRFARGTEWRDRVNDALSEPRKGPGRALVEDWNEPPRYQKDEQGRVTRWDFYGGTLSGIRENLDYLHDLGVTALYINPVFEAASNHRYDTADYTRIDPMLGDEDEFRALCFEAEAHGISVILDGVFNHTGCDSLYFNKYGNYDTVGAWQGEDSPYRDWYCFDEDGDYSSWWGVGDLPDINESNPEYRKLMFDKNGVVRKWLRAGARGWRLDVADELPDDFLVELKAAACAERPDALVLGEVWEDASHKVAYDKLRRYFMGDELDGVMNYNLRVPLLEYVMGEEDGGALAERVESMHENYPPEAFAQALNMLGTHDTRRVFSVLGGAPEPDGMSDDERASYRLSEGQRGLAKGRLWLSALLQMTLPGVPCVYYGDEAGVEGYADPYNRAPFPWGHEDRDCQTIYRNAINLRRTLPMLATGDFEALPFDGDVFGFVRTDAATGESAAVLVNRSLSNQHEVRVPMRGEVVDEVVGGRRMRVENGEVVVPLSCLGSAVLYFHSARELGREPERGSGVLCHVTSLPAAEKNGEVGTLGAPSRSFCEWLERAGQRYWQILPVNPTDAFGSPYAGLSAFAGNASLVSTADAEARVKAAKADKGGTKAGKAAVAAGAKGGAKAEQAPFERFCSDNAAWLEPYAAFMAAKDLVGADVPWQEWPADLRDYTPELPRDPRLAKVADRIRREQYEFQLQWDALRECAHAHGVSIVGDMPMYVSGDSADVWANRPLFRLDALGRPDVVAGTPPDAFSEDGQIWGNPVYDWDAMRASGYDWWMRRLERAFALYDYVRLDHFLGFSSFYAIPRGADARQGRWRVGPGREIFELAYERFGALPVIAEDLGLLTPAIRALVATCGFAGMDVSVFSDTFSEGGWAVPRGKVAYSSTHDTQTLVGWSAGRVGEDAAPEAAARALEACERSTADLVVVQLQDACGLGDDSRMNLPGVAKGNWSWVADPADIEGATERMRCLAEASGRA